MLAYAESTDCRRALLLGYFGETWSGGPCDGCDNCLVPRARFDGTLVAHKFLSNVVRVRAAGGFAVGLNHLVDVLLGKATGKVRDWNHDVVSTFGIGKDTARAQWLAIGRELLRLGMVRQSGGLRSVVELTETGRRTLLERRAVTLTARPAAGERAAGDAAPAGRAYDEDLFDALRALRKRLADERDVPAYVIFPDTTLRQMARDLPRTAAQLRAVAGVGDPPAVAEVDDVPLDIALGLEVESSFRLKQSPEIQIPMREYLSQPLERRRNWLDPGR